MALCPRYACGTEIGRALADVVVVGLDLVLAPVGRIERLALDGMKPLALEVETIRHRKEDRIRAHIFLCMLAFYI